MTLWEAVFCGIIQGVSEFLPISSSGHLALTHAFFSFGEEKGNLTFDILLHFATLIVVFVVYYKDIFALIPAFFGLLKKIFHGKFRISFYTQEERTVLFLFIATLPLAVAFFIKDQVELIAGYTRAVGLILILNGLLLWTADHFAKRMQKRELTPKGALGIGLFQLAAATLPGLSRSGSTIAGGLFFGLSRKDAVKFSFILSIPAILGANILNLPEAFSASISEQTLVFYLVGMAAAMVFGFLSMKLLIYISEKEKFGFFAYYSIAVGALAVFFS